MKNKTAIKAMIESGMTEKQAKYYVKSISDLGYSSKTVLMHYTVEQVKEIVDSVDRALANHFNKRTKQ